MLQKNELRSLKFIFLTPLQNQQEGCVCLFPNMIMMQVSAKIKPVSESRICQGDIFHDLEIVENVEETSFGARVHYLRFPLVVCLNQDCDLSRDDRDKQEENSNKNCRLLHLIVAPVFFLDTFKSGEHWGQIFDIGDKFKLDKTTGKKLTNNEDPRYHFLHFLDNKPLPDLVIDFKHFFTISTQYMYSNLDKRVCSIEELYREKISQRFANYLSRIGLPE